MIESTLDEIQNYFSHGSERDSKFRFEDSVTALFQVKNSFMVWSNANIYFMCKSTFSTQTQAYTVALSTSRMPAKLNLHSTQSSTMFQH